MTNNSGGRWAQIGKIFPKLYVPWVKIQEISLQYIHVGATINAFTVPVTHVWLQSSENKALTQAVIER